MTHPLLRPGRIGPLELRNRVVKPATNEGMAPGGRPDQALVDHHVAMARAGVGMTTVAYGAVSPRGRTFGDQLLVDDEAMPMLRQLTDAVHGEGAAVSLQLAHCGGFSKLRGYGAPAGPSAGFNAYGLAYGLPRVRAMTAGDREQTTLDYVAAARRAVEAGFDALELHLGHGYLLSQYLSPAFNRRRDEYGGSLERRARFPLEVLRAIREGVGAGTALVVKTNLQDAVPGGLALDESAEVAGWLAEAGADAIEPSGGIVSRNAFYLLRGEVPVREMANAEESPLQRLAIRAFAPFLMRPTPFEEAFFLDDARRILEAVDIPVILLGGLVSRAGLDRAAEAGFPFVAMGRALIADPDLLHRLAAGEHVASRCDHCNRCVAEMDVGGVRCVLD